ncbi:hypothetical protein FACS1894188_04160 [Clostridia bacterium]|nr:hypothetical protein FACS1894188_04160 [Clostridia bacterium]
MNPTDFVTRDEFANLLVNAYGLRQDNQKDDSVTICVQQGVMSGYKNGQLFLDKYCTRAEVVTALSKASNIL